MLFITPNTLWQWRTLHTSTTHIAYRKLATRHWCNCMWLSIHCSSFQHNFAIHMHYCCIIGKWTIMWFCIQVKYRKKPNNEMVYIKWTFSHHLFAQCQCKRCNTEPCTSKCKWWYSATILSSITVYIILLGIDDVIENHFLIALLVTYSGNLLAVHCSVNYNFRNTCWPITKSLILAVLWKQSVIGKSKMIYKEYSISCTGIEFQEYSIGEDYTKVYHKKYPC